MRFEYLIRFEGGGRFVFVPPASLAEVLAPRGYGFEPVDGPGDLRVRLGSVEIEYSLEMPGWQITIDGAEDRAWADAVVDTVARQLEEVTGSSAVVVRL